MNLYLYLIGSMISIDRLHEHYLEHRRSLPVIRLLVMCMTEIDDILVTGKDNEEHLHNLGEVLRQLKEASMKFKREKSLLFVRS